MNTNDSYKMPTIRFETREDLIDFFTKTKPLFIFEQVEEVNNPQGRQWNVIISTKIQADDIGTAIVEYKESIYEYLVNDKEILSSWLKTTCPFIENFYKGQIKS